ncbi:MAG: RidA family protein [bacterium]|jgi:hypothetical protein
MDVYKRLGELGIELPTITAPFASFLLAKEFGDKMLYLSGTGPVFQDGKPLFTGQLGKELTVEEGQQAARSVGLSMLANLHTVTGDLNRVKSIVKVLGFISSAPGFFSQPAVLNGFSDLMVEVFGPEIGSHARSAIGTSVLPFNIPIEVEILVELK